MSPTFKCLLVTKPEQGYRVDFTDLAEDQLPAGDVMIAVSHSTLNYKDGLALTGKAPIVRRFPMIPGIDLAGTVMISDDPGFKPGDAVAVTGRGLSEVHFGGYSERARVPASWLIKLAAPLTPQRAMAVGTAGYTAMLCVLALEDHGITPERGTIVVSGASGGVGSIAIMLLKRLGYTVAAITGRPEEADFLRMLGATEIIDRAEFAAAAPIMDKTRWAGAVDAAGSHTVANILAQTAYGGVVTACGLAHGMDLSSHMAPFILRAVSLVGVESVHTPTPLLQRAWARLKDDLDMAKLDALSTTIAFKDLPDIAADILAGRVRGRVIVSIG